jgi:FMN-dependent NADH-azoreductase
MLVLNIQSSPRGAKSASIAVTNAFLDAYQVLHSDATIDTLNVWEENLPDFDSEAIGAKYKGVSHKPMDAAEAEIWERIQTLAKRFQRADRIVLGVPIIVDPSNWTTRRGGICYGPPRLSAPLVPAR